MEQGDSDRGVPPGRGPPPSEGLRFLALGLTPQGPQTAPGPGQGWRMKGQQAARPGFGEGESPLLTPHCIPQGLPRERGKLRPKGVLLPPQPALGPGRMRVLGVAEGPGSKANLLCRKEKDFSFWLLKAERAGHAETSSSRGPFAQQRQRNKGKMPQFPNPAVRPPRPRYLPDLCEHQASWCHMCCSTSRISCLQSAETLSSWRQSLGPAAHHVTCSSWSIYLVVIMPVVLVGLVIIYWQCMKTRRLPGEQRSCQGSGPEKSQPRDPPRSIPQI